MSITYNESNVNGETTLCIEKDASLNRMQTTSIQTSFLEGNITDTYVNSNDHISYGHDEMYRLIDTVPHPSPTPSPPPSPVSPKPSKPVKPPKTDGCPPVRTEEAPCTRPGVICA